MGEIVTSKFSRQVGWLEGVTCAAAETTFMAAAVSHNRQRQLTTVQVIG